MRTFVLIAAVFALAACGQGATTKGDAAQDGSSAASESESTAATPETEILKLYADYDAYQAQASAIAAERAQSRATKDFAATRAQAHDAAAATLTQGVHAANAPAPDAALDENMQAYLTMLREVPPAQFDGAYASQQSLMHTTTAGRLLQFAQTHADSPLAPWAAARASELQAVLAEARSLPR